MQDTRKITGSFDEILKVAFGLIEANQLAEAQSIFQQLLAQFPEHPEVLFGLGLVAYRAQALDQAQAIFERVLAQHPNHCPSLDVLSAILYQQQRWEPAIGYAQRLVALMPGEAVPLFNLACLYRRQGCHKEAIIFYQQALAINPNYLECLFDLGLIYQAEKQFDTALIYYQQVLALQPQNVECLNMVGNAYQAKEQWQMAEQFYLQALALRPDYAECHANLGVMYKMQGEWEKATAAYMRALELQPDSATALVNLSHLQLLFGEFTQGFKNYAARPLLPSMSIPLSDTLPFWDGQASLQQTTVYILPEQGYGDYFLFIRFSEQLKARGATVIAVCEPNLQALIRSNPWVDDVYTANQFACCYSGYQIPIMELARLLQMTTDTIPCHVPYLFADEDKVQQLSGLFSNKSLKKIGLVWSGNPAFPANTKRSIPFAALQPLLAIPNTQFYSLIMNERLADLASCPNSIIDMHSYIHDFSDTAAIVQHLDLVISVDTSLVHLVGALNKPCWLLLSDVPYWCWQLNRSDSPWYSSLRLFRQPSPGDWDAVVQAVIEQLIQIFPDCDISKKLKSK